MTFWKAVGANLVAGLIIAGASVLIGSMLRRE